MQANDSDDDAQPPTDPADIDLKVDPEGEHRIEPGDLETATR